MSQCGRGLCVALAVDVPLLISEENKMLCIDLIFLIYTSARAVQYGEFYV